MANGLTADQAKPIAESLQKAFGPCGHEHALLDEAVRLSKTAPQNAPAIAAAAATFVHTGHFAVKVAETTSRAVRPHAPAIAGAVAAVLPGAAPRVAARVAHAVPSATLRVTRRVAHAVPEAVEGIEVPSKHPPGIEKAVIVAVPMVNPASVYNAAYVGAKQAAREGGSPTG